MCLPQGISIVKTAAHQFTVVSCRASISKGTRFGPYRGRVVQPWQVKEGEDNKYLWEVSIVLLVDKKLAMVSFLWNVFYKHNNVELL